MNVDDIGADSEGDEDDGEDYEHEDSGDDRDHEEDGDDPDVDDDGYDDCGIEASMANGDDDYDKMILKGMTMMMTMMMTM